MAENIRVEIEWVMPDGSCLGREATSLEKAAIAEQCLQILAESLVPGVKLRKMKKDPSNAGASRVSR